MAFTDDQWAARLRATLRWSHDQHTGDCMSDEDERFRAVMDKGSVEMNHRNHMADVERGLEAAVADAIARSKVR